MRSRYISMSFVIIAICLCYLNNELLKEQSAKRVKHAIVTPAESTIIIDMCRDASDRVLKELLDNTCGRFEIIVVVCDDESKYIFLKEGFEKRSKSDPGLMRSIIVNAEEDPSDMSRLRIGIRSSTYDVVILYRNPYRLQPCWNLDLILPMNIWDDIIAVSVRNSMSRKVQPVLHIHNLFDPREPLALNISKVKQIGVQNSSMQDILKIAYDERNWVLGTVPLQNVCQSSECKMTKKIPLKTPSREEVALARALPLDLNVPGEPGSINETFVIMTAFSENHLDAIDPWYTSVRCKFPLSPVIIYILDELTSWSPPPYDMMVEVRRFPFVLYPTHVHLSKHSNGECYAWKAIVVDEVSREFKRILWLDTGNRLTKETNVSLLLDLLNRVGFVSLPTQGSVKDWVHEKAFSAFSIPMTADVLQQPMLDGSFLFFDFDFPDARSLFTAWLYCSLQRDCICPVGTSRLNHRQDQAVITLLTYTMFHSIGADITRCIDVLLSVFNSIPHHQESSPFSCDY